LLSPHCRKNTKGSSPEASPCSLRRIFGNGSPRDSPSWSMVRRQKGAQVCTLTPGNLLAVLRGRKMKEHIRDLQLQYQRACLQRRVQDEISRSSELQTLKKHFLLWVKLHASMRALALEKAMKKRGGGDAAVDGLPCVGWRVEEEYRRRRRQWLQHARSSGILKVCFSIWRELPAENRVLTPQKAFMALFSETSDRSITPQKAFMALFSEEQPGSPTARGRPGSPTARRQPMLPKQEEPEDDGSLPIGSRLCGQAPDAELLRQLRVLERLYETRVAAAERLLAFYVLFHSAVEPISKLWWLSFDMDRSESRLRVASTPAPVPFVESLPQLPDRNPSMVPGFLSGAADVIPDLPIIAAQGDEGRAEDVMAGSPGTEILHMVV